MPRVPPHESVPDPSSPPYSYRAFGLTVGSDMELSGFVPTPAPGTPDVRVTQGTPSSDFNGDSYARARAEGVLRASLAEGREVIVEVNPEADPLYVSAVVTGELFSVVLRQRGMLVLHGSGVSKDGHAVGFIGDSGWGKSTLAASLVERGWELLTDDLLVVDGLRPGGIPMAVPTHPSMRLSTEAIDRVNASDQAHGQAHALTTKVRIDQSGAFSDRPAPLRQLFVLDPRPSDRHQATPLSAREAVDEFVRHTRGRRLLTAPSALTTHLGQCAALARCVPTASLRRQFGLDHMDALCDVVESGVGEPVAS